MQSPGSDPGAVVIFSVDSVISALRSADGANFLSGDLLFRPKPVVYFVAVFPAAFLIEFIRALAKLLLELLRVTRHRRRRFLRSVGHGVTLL